MQCPVCKKHIFQVDVYAECWQKGFLTENRITSYGSVEEVSEMLAAKCPECHSDITEHVVRE